MSFKINSMFLIKKRYIGLHDGIPRLQERPPALKREYPALQKHENFSPFFFFVGLFCPPGSGSAFQMIQSTKINYGSMLIQIHNTGCKYVCIRYLKRDMRGAEDSGECGYSCSPHSHTSVLNMAREQYKHTAH
jgi:hypothetical protein